MSACVVGYSRVLWERSTSERLLTCGMTIEFAELLSTLVPLRAFDAVRGDSPKLLVLYLFMSYCLCSSSGKEPPRRGLTWSVSAEALSEIDDEAQ